MIEDVYPQIKLNVEQDRSLFLVKMSIAEVLKKDEIKSFYNEVILPKINYLSSNNIDIQKTNYVLNSILSLGIEKRYKYMKYDIYSNRTELELSFIGL